MTDEVKMMDLPRRMPIKSRGECINQRFVVCEHVEVSPFQEIPETFDGEVNSQEFRIIRAVSCLSRFQGSGEKCQWTPQSINVLEHSSHSNIRSVSHDTSRCIGSWVNEK